MRSDTTMGLCWEQSLSVGKTLSPALSGTKLQSLRRSQEVLSDAKEKSPIRGKPDSSKNVKYDKQKLVPYIRPPNEAIKT